MQAADGKKSALLFVRFTTKLSKNQIYLSCSAQILTNINERNRQIGGSCDIGVKREKRATTRAGRCKAPAAS
jgi:hypothetical protein